MAPVSEDANAVSACHNGVKVVSQLMEGDSDVDVLLDGEGWLDVECDLGDDAESAETDEVQRVLSTVMSSRAVTAVARLPLWSPELWVEVLHVPTMESCVSEARLWRAKFLLAR